MTTSTTPRESPDRSAERRGKDQRTTVRGHSAPGSTGERWFHVAFRLVDIDGETCGSGEGGTNAKSEDAAWLALTFLLQQRYPSLALAKLVVGAVKVSNAQRDAAAWVKFVPPTLFGEGGAA